MTIRLNPDQQAAAECLDRPVLVTAGAGSGKTRMLTQRFVNAVVPGAIDGWVPATVDQLVAITFTEKAAGEIAERVREALRAEGCAQQARELATAWISTIHGLCSRLLRTHAFEAGVDPLFSVADTLVAGQLREKAFEEAAREALEQNPEAGDLFDAFDYAVLFSASVAVARELAVAGYSPDGIRLEPVDGSRSLIGQAQELFREGMTSCELGYSGTSSDPWDHRGRCEELLGRCSVLVADEREDEELLSELLDALVAYRPLRKLKGLEEMAAALSAAKEELIGRTAAALTAPYARALRDLVARFQSRYARAKAEGGLLDFEDLQMHAVRLLGEHREIAEAYRERFRVVMIDEFQDTDALQLRLVEALAEDDLCTVGDEKQSIYRFRGADIDVYRQHRARMQEAGAFVSELRVNYRSHPDILSFVNHVFSDSDYFGGDLLKLTAPPDRVEGPLDGILGSGPRVEALFVDSTDVDSDRAREVEARTIAERLAELCSAGIQPRDIAVLVRTYTHAHAYAAALSDVGMRAVVVGGSRFFGLPEIAIMRALNRVIANPEDGAALGELLACDFVPMSSSALALMRLRGAERDKAPIWDALRREAPAFAQPDRMAAERLIGVLLRAQERAGRIGLAEVLMLAVEESGWDLRLLSEGNTGRDAFANVLKFLRQASAFEAHGGSGAAGFAQHLDNKERLGDTEAPASLADDGSDAVRIMSIHASKGLEFPVVVVPALAGRGRGDSLAVRSARRDGGLDLALKTPSGSDGQSRPASTWFTQLTDADAGADAEESARVFYVACTRAQDYLLLSGSTGLRPKNGTKAKNDLVRLARILGVSIPVDGPMDVAAGLGATGAECRVRVLLAEPSAGLTAPEETAAEVGPLLPDGGLARVQEGSVPALSRISYTQLSEFEHCPRQFWVRRILGIREQSGANADELDPLRFGQALHSALRLVDQFGNPPGEERLSAIGRYFELGAEGTLRLITAVRRYCESATQRRVSASGTVRRESPFAIDIAGSFLLIGSIDLYARTDSSALLVDYKSGGSGEAAQLAERYRLQARCYALAVLRDGCSAVSVEFVRPEVDAAEGDMQRVTFDFSAQDAPRIEAELLARYEAIQEARFDPAPSHDCVHCDMLPGLCPERAERRGRR